MAQGTKISEMPIASDLNDADVLAGVQNNVNKKFSLSVIAAWVQQKFNSVFIPVGQKGANSGVATLDASGKVPDSQLDLSTKQDKIAVSGILKGDGNGGVYEAQEGTDYGTYSKPIGGIPASDLASGVIPSTPSAADVDYDNTQSGLTADDVQEALDELAAGAGGSTAATTSYDNTDSGLAATNAQDAIDELADEKADQTTVAPVEASATATVAHPLGSIFYLNGVLYRALSDIAVGGTINTASGGNATQTTVAQNFKRTVTLTSAQYAQLSAAEKAADIVYIVTDDNSIPAEDVEYDNTASGLTATDVQEAIDEVYGDIPSQPSDIGAQDEITASGILKGDGAGGVSAAVSGTDYQAPLTAGTDYATPAQLEGKANQSQLATEETGTTASRAYAVGEYFCWNGLLYRVTAAISSGASFTVGTNCEQVLEGGLNALETAIAGKGNTKYTGYYAATTRTINHSVNVDKNFLILTTGVSTSGDRAMGIFMGFVSASNAAASRVFKVFEPSAGQYPCTVSVSTAGQISVTTNVAYVRVTILEFERTVF